MFLNWFRQQKWRNWRIALHETKFLTSNEIRSVIGIKPSTAPQADELRNKNMPVQAQPIIQESNGQFQFLRGQLMNKKYSKGVYMTDKIKYDFSGYATKVGLKCSDGRTILQDAFSR